MKAYLKVLPAISGDALLLHWGHEGKNYNMIIDGGFLDTYGDSVKPELVRISKREENIDLWIITHLDADHINGAVAYFRDEPMLTVAPLKECWFNFFDRFTVSSESTRVSVAKGIELREKLRAHRINCPDSILAGHTIELGGAKIRVLSPDQETYDALEKVWIKEEKAYHRARPSSKVVGAVYDFDQSIRDLAVRHDKKEKKSDIINRSSIAIWMELNGKNLLFLGDAHPSVIIAELNKIREEKKVDRLPVDFVKLAHHASRQNYSGALLDTIEADNFIISSNGMNTACLPNKETLAKILTHEHRVKSDTPLRFYFNYRNQNLESMFTVDSRKVRDLNFQCVFPARGKDLKINLDQ